MSKTFGEISKYFLRNARRIADMINAVVYDVEQIITPEDIHVFDSEKSTVLESLDGFEGIQRTGDLIRLVSHQQTFVLYAIENQQKIDERMVLRTLEYAALDYQNQYDENDEHRIYPVIPIVMYYGEKKWDAPLSLSEMTEVPEILKDEFTDWKYRLAEVRELDTKLFHDRQMKAFVQGIQDLYKIKRNGKVEMKELDYEVAITLAVYSGSTKLIDYYIRKGEKVNMCEALENYANEAKAEGRNEGLAAGKEIGRSEGLAAGKEIGKNEGILIGEKLGIQSEQKRIYENLIRKLHMSEEEARNITGYSDETAHLCVI